MKPILAELRLFCDEKKKDLMDKAFQQIGQTKAEAKLGLIRGGLLVIDEFEHKISQLEKRDS